MWAPMHCRARPPYPSLRTLLICGALARIGEDDGVPFKVDICGGGAGDDGAGSFRGRNDGVTTSGYVTSPNYPHRYSPNTYCRCVLNATSGDRGAAPPAPAAEILLGVLDHDLSRLPSDLSPADWVEYVVSGRQRWADGTRIAADVTSAAADDVIRTGADAVEINFRSDAANERRGFWIAYYGKRRRLRSTLTNLRAEDIIEN